jgi:hypothetical protein
MLMDSLLTVVTPAVTYDLTTLEIAYEELGITDATNDARMSRWISATSDYIARYCNRVFAQETVAEKWRQADRWIVRETYAAEPFRLSRYPVVEVASIALHDGTLLTPEQYELDAVKGILWRANEGTRCDWYEPTVTITYTGGYNVPDQTPYALEQACLMLLKVRNDNIARDRMLRAIVVPGVLEEQYWGPTAPGMSAAAMGMPPEIADILNQFRDLNI